VRDESACVWIASYQASGELSVLPTLESTRDPTTMSDPTPTDIQRVRVAVESIDIIMRVQLETPMQHVAVIAQLVASMLARIPKQSREPALDHFLNAAKSAVPAIEKEIYGDAGHPRSEKI
jgi:hypothetical protein